MNFRITALLFALLLTMLWVFGYMLQHKKGAVDNTLVMPTLAREEVKIESITIKRVADKDAKEPLDAVDAEFVQEFERWYQVQSGQKVRVEGFRINNIIDEIKKAKHDETADVFKDAKFYGLDKPRLVVTLTGKAKDIPKTWEFNVGEERAGMVYIKTSDRDKIAAIPRQSLGSLYFKKAEHLRSRRLFDFVDTEVKSIFAKKAGKDELELKRGERERWDFVTPKLGIASISEPAAPDDKKKDPHKKQPFTPPAEKSSVMGLLSSIIAIHVEDDEHFLPIGKSAADYKLKSGEEELRIEIRSGEPDKKAVGSKTTETLLIGKREKVDQEEFAYARLDGDAGIMKINTRFLEPIEKAILTPEKLRSLDVAAFDKTKVDVVVLKQGKEATEFFRMEEKAEMKFPPMQDFGHQWYVFPGKDKKKASDAMLSALLDLSLGQKSIVEFPKGKEDELKKKEVEWGLDPASTPLEIVVYENGIEAPKKADKKDDVKDEKKDTPPTLKKDHKAEVTLFVGKIDKENVHIRRELKDGSKTYLTLKKEFREKVLPPEGIELAYLDTSLPKLAVSEVVGLKFERTTDKGAKKVDVDRRFGDGKSISYMVDSDSPGVQKLADSSKVTELLSLLAASPVSKWIKKTDKGEDLEKYGLKAPAIRATITLRKPVLTGLVAGKDKDGKDIKVSTALGFVGQLADGGVNSALGAASYAIATTTKDEEETIVLEFGKESEDAKEKTTYAKHSGTQILFAVPTPFIKLLKEIDLTDRSAALFTQPELEAFYRGSAASSPISMLMLASPHISGLVHDFDPESVKEVRLMVRTPAEVRRFQFDRTEKPKVKEKEKVKEKIQPKDDKAKVDPPKDAKDAKDTKEKVSKWNPWVNKTTGLDEFQVDPEKVTALVKDFSRLHASRFATIMEGPRPEHKLTDKEATIKLEMVLDDGKTITLYVGAEFSPHGDRYATSSVWTRNDGKASTVFFLSPTKFEAILRGAEHFGKERSAGN
ncbi:MAG: DUF4340 domain-containing protein [Planctomycetes bacterium]|nr:DUF4340 domain-containing protein [Planctomycetota bacterium]